MNFLIIGYGLIGKERVNALLRIKEMSPSPINIYVTDIVNMEEYLPYGVQWANETTFVNKAPDWVFICTPHHAMRDWLSVVSTWGSKVLVEKPFGRNYLESLDMYNMLPKPEDVIVGFNYRFYPAVQHLLTDMQTKTLGNIISVNMVLGHGGSPYDRDSWKLDPVLGAESSLLDPGIHLLDIASLIFKTLEPYDNFGHNNFVWKTGVEEESHVLLIGDGMTTINIQTSLIKWRSTFRIEVNGDLGYTIIEGKGRSYGEQTYTKGFRWAWNGGQTQRESETFTNYGECKDSFYDEIVLALGGFSLGKNCSAKHALKVMELYNEIMAL